ncbi:MAG: SirB2 family protein [Pseudomonadales bacterium]
MNSLTALHVALAYLTVTGFFVRGAWALADSPLGRERWVKVAPHVVDTLLLSLGVLLALRLGISPLSGWLAAKLLGLLAYIGFGVLTLRARSKALQGVGFVAALCSAGYIFAVALSRSPWPF